MSALLPWFITWWQQYGYPVMWVTIFIAALGVPVPISLMLLAAGAFASEGDFNIVVLIIIAVSASVSGDIAGYWIGRWVGQPFLDWFGKKQRLAFISPETVIRSQVYFKRRGGWAVFLSRFLLSGLGGVTNLVAGAENFPFHRFFVLDFGGEVLGALIPLLLGFAFGASWEVVGNILGGTSELMLALLCFLILLRQIIKLLLRSSSAQEARKKQAARLTTTKLSPSLSEGSEGSSPT